MRYFWYGSVDSPNRHERNWGDIFTPHLLAPLLGHLPVQAHRNAGDKLLSVGSVLHRLRANDSVWGAGIISGDHYPKPLPPGLVFHAVRGPLTRKVLMKAGAEVPEIYGDPALLSPYLFQVADRKITHKLGVIPHYMDVADVTKGVQGKPGVKVIDICAGFHQVIQEVCSCETILSSTLHGLVLGDCYAEKTAWLRVKGGDNLVGKDFKFKDYLLSTHREPEATDTTGPLPDDSAIRWLPKPQIDLAKLLAACPCNETGIMTLEALPQLIISEGVYPVFQ